MPLYLSVPLPGPFRYSTRVGGGRGGGVALYWLFIAWWWLPLKWTVLALVYLTVWMVKGATWICIEAGRRL